jgi:Family of unknown function (DUF6152)
MSNRFTRTLSVTTATALLAFAGVALAHHSAAQWNLDKRIAITGTVKSVTFRNPHGLIELDVKGPDGKAVTWHVETSAVNLLMRRGWKPGRVKVGESVTIAGHLKKVPGNELYMREIKLADGTSFGDPAGQDKQLD